MVENLDPDNALLTIDKAISQLNGTREMHVVLQNCVNTLQAVIVDWKKSKEHKENCKCNDSKEDKLGKKGR